MIWHSTLLTQFSNIYHGSSSKSFGVIRFDSGAGDEEVIHNRQRLLESIPVDPNKAFIVFQEHGNRVLRINGEQDGSALLQQDQLAVADGLVTNEKGVTLIARSADCVPVFFYDAKQEAIGVAHAGWKGTSKNIVQEVVGTMKNEYKTDPKDLFVSIGPSICGQCYDISQTTDDRKDRFNRLFTRGDQVLLRHDDDSISLDLKRANKLFALKMGVPEHQIEVSSICTFEDKEYASYRRNKDELAHSIWSYISLK